jgi:hypothetical protein
MERGLLVFAAFSNKRRLTMPEGMLGKLRLSEVRGPLNDLNEKLAGPRGSSWLRDLKKMLRNLYTISIGDGQTKEHVLDAGGYVWVGLGGEDDRVRKFIMSSEFRWATDPKEVDIELVEFNHDPTTDEVLEDFARRGLVEPMEEDVLRFGHKYPDLQGDSSIVFLHSGNPLPKGMNGEPSVLTLSMAVYGRGINHGSIEFGKRWSRHCKFAGRCSRK